MWELWYTQQSSDYSKILTCGDEAQVVEEDNERWRVMSATNSKRWGQRQPLTDYYTPSWDVDTWELWDTQQSSDYYKVLTCGEEAQVVKEDNDR